MICGGYLYFSTYTSFLSFGERHRDIRKPCTVSKKRFIESANLLGHSPFLIDDNRGFNVWLRARGWSVVDKEYAHTSMQQWLKAKECVSSSIGVYTDIEIVSPSTLKRSYSGNKKEHIVERDGRKCIECGATDQLTMHHIIAHSKGGENTSRNMVTLCDSCNQMYMDFEDISLFEAAGIHYGYDRSLINHQWYSLEHKKKAAQISDNLMQTRCEVW